jgi:farnesyl diphosphate synthase
MIARENAHTFDAKAEQYRRRVEAKLESAVRSAASFPPRLSEAIEYCVLGPGKRMRPLLAYASGELFSISPPALDAVAAAVELVHAYSLVHDDLPAMDDDDLRRGRPTAHRAFDEATAILAGDGLQALAFEILCGDESLTDSPDRRIAVLRLLAEAAGPAGMVGGQMLDLLAEGRTLTEAELEDVHRRKTGALIRAAIMMPAQLAAADAGLVAALDRIAMEIGLLFQICDDLLEVDQDTTTLGKSATSDRDNRKSTYPSVLGVAEARQRARSLYDRIVADTARLGPAAEGLRWVIDSIYQRTR